MSNKHFFDVVQSLGKDLNDSNIPYQFINSTSLILQGVLKDSKQDIHISIQWDLFDSVLEKYSRFNPEIVKKDELEAVCSLNYDGFHVILNCVYNTSIKTDPFRILVEYDKTQLWCQSLYAYLQEENEYMEEIRKSLLERQQEVTNQNETAWNQNNYQALLNRHGSPNEVAAKINKNPRWRLYPFYKYMGNVQDKKILHLMGSNGIKGTALAILGANVTIVDFSQENQRFATEVAHEAGVHMNYIVSDVLSLDEKTCDEGFDIVLMELGVLHYYIDLAPLAEIVARCLNKSGMFILHEFHPISTKLITSTGKKHKVTGDYFDPTIKIKEVAFTKHMNSEDQKQLSNVLQRHWTLGEIITAFARAGLMVQTLEEEPNHKLHDIGLPKTFTLCATKV